MPEESPSTARGTEQEETARAEQSVLSCPPALLIGLGLLPLTPPCQSLVNSEVDQEINTFRIRS